MGVLSCPTKDSATCEQQILEDAEVLTNFPARIDPNSSPARFRLVQKLEKLSYLMSTWGDEGDGAGYYDHAVLVALLEVLKNPRLLSNSLNALLTESLQRLISHGEGAGLLQEKLPGLYLSLVHLDAQVRSWAIETVKELGSLDQDEYDQIKEVLDWLLTTFNLFDLQPTTAEECSALVEGIESQSCNLPASLSKRRTQSAPNLKCDESMGDDSNQPLPITSKVTTPTATPLTTATTLQVSQTPTLPSPLATSTTPTPQVIPAPSTPPAPSTQPGSSLTRNADDHKNDPDIDDLKQEEEDDHKNDPAIDDIKQEEEDDHKNDPDIDDIKQEEEGKIQWRKCILVVPTYIPTVALYIVLGIFVYTSFHYHESYSDFGGKFNLPENFHLVSAIYEVSSSENFKENVSIQIHHYAIISSDEETADYAFIKGRHSGTNDAYTFEILNGAFSPHSQLATISLNHFCKLGSVANSTRPTKTYRYAAHAYQRHNPAQPTKLELEFLLTPRETIYEKILNDEYTGWNKSVKAFDIAFEGDSITLDINTNTKVEPHTPLQIEKGYIDDLCEGESEIIPSSKVLVGLKEEQPMSFNVNLLGAKPPRNFFTVSAPPRPFESSKGHGESAWYWIPPVCLFILILLLRIIQFCGKPFPSKFVDTSFAVLILVLYIMIARMIEDKYSQFVLYLLGLVLEVLIASANQQFPKSQATLKQVKNFLRNPFFR